MIPQCNSMLKLIVYVDFLHTLVKIILSVEPLLRCAVLVT
jgi:hypothetical protein